MRTPDVLLMTCEHGGNRVPRRYRPLLEDAAGALAGHRGHDIGAAAIARRVARRLRAPLRVASVTRLLVDLNRSPGHPRRFSEYVRTAGEPALRAIDADHYTPYREAVERDVARLVARGRRVLHLSVHSFTPVLDGVRRDVDIGLLYDPSRRAERAWCRRWGALLARMRPDLRIRRNAPYRGTADGLTTFLRRRFPAGRYLGIEIEVNQTLACDAPGPIAGLISESLRRLAASGPVAPGGGRARRAGVRHRRRRTRRPSDRSTPRSSRNA